MTEYRVDFTRIGRAHYVPPLLTEADDAGHLAVKIHRYARPFLASRDVEVAVDLTDGSGDMSRDRPSGRRHPATGLDHRRSRRRPDRRQRGHES